MKSKKFYIQINSSWYLEDILSFLIDWKDLTFKIKAEEELYLETKKYLEINWKRHFDWLVIWTEFCEHLNINTIEVLKNIVLLKNKDFEFIINTTILTSYNVEYYELLFTYLKDNNFKIKVIINDIWFIELLDKLWLNNTEKIIWRLISRQRKVFIRDVEDKYKESTIEFNYFNDFFTKKGIKHFVYDILPQWNELSDYENKYLLFPWGYYTSSRACITKSYISGKNYVFPLKKCNKPCIYSYIEFIHNNDIIQKWNTVFYKSLKYISVEDFNKFDKYIYQPYIPI